MALSGQVLSAWRSWFWPAFVFLFGMALCLLYGRLALHPLDSSIVFDGGWRLLQGQEFFVDFATPNGFVPIYLQSWFFELFGVSWFSYCLHAAVFNGLFGLMVYALLRHYGGNRGLSGFYAVLSTVVFYPPVGTPYMDQHAFFFGLGAVLLAAKAGKWQGGWRWGAVAAIPVVTLWGLLSKQIPAGFVVPLVVVMLMVGIQAKDWGRAFLSLLAGLGIGILTLGLLFDFGAMDVVEAEKCVREMPAEEGAARWAELARPVMAWVRTLMLRVYQVLADGNFLNTTLMYAPLLLLIPLAIRKWWGKENVSEEGATFAMLIPAWGLGMVSSLFILLTNNQPEIGLAYVFCCVGLMHIWWLKWLAVAPYTWLDRLPLRPLLPFFLSIILVLNASLDAFHIHQRINVTRTVHDLTKPAPSAFEAPKGLSGLDFLAYSTYGYRQALSPDSLLTFLATHPGNIYLHGDQSFLYGLAVRPNPLPALWFHEGLSLPRRSTPDFARLDQRLHQNLRALQVRYAIFERPSKSTYMDVPAMAFTQTFDWLQAQKVREFKVGGFEIWELKTPNQ